MPTDDQEPEHPVQPAAVMPLWRRVRITINDKPVPKVLQAIIARKESHESH